MSDSVPTSGPTKHANRLFAAGVVVSAIYVGGLALYGLVMRDALVALKPNEFAEFLAGVFAPLAFLWLVLGFRQQGDELQNSARALWLQGEELRNSVEQQRQLVEVSRAQLAAEAEARREEESEADRRAQPRLVYSSGGTSISGGRHQKMTYRLQNAGPPCSDLRLFVNGELVEKCEVMDVNRVISTVFDYEDPSSIAPRLVNVEYTDQRGNRRSQAFYIPVSEHGGLDGMRTLGDPERWLGLDASGDDLAELR